MGEVPVEGVVLDFDGSRLLDSQIGHVIHQSFDVGRRLLGRRIFLGNFFEDVGMLATASCSRSLILVSSILVS